jgi:alkylation response protein AidB-like acyl-CoA dehydrogenase
MDFELTEFQTDLAEGVRRLCTGRFPLESLRAVEGSEQVVDRKGWRELGDAGVFNLRMPEADGGVGLGLPEAVLVFEELGRALVPGPLVATHLAAGLVDGAADGSAVVGLVERPAPGATIPLLVEHLSDLEALVVLSDEGVHSVDPSALTAAAVHRPMDPLTPLWLVAALPAGTPLGGSDVSARWRRDGAVLTAALQVGSAGWSTELATAYAKQRTQFGRVIGGFQAVKHICADMLVRAEVARVAVQAAAVTIVQPDVGNPEVAARGAKVLADEAALANGRSCIQVHGGMGFTWEVPAHLAYKRARVLATQFGLDDELAEWLGDSLAT